MNRSVRIGVLAALVFISTAGCVRAAPPVAADAADANAVKAKASAHIAWPAGLPVYDHIVIVMEENKDFEQVIGSSRAPYINGTLKAEGASLTQMYGEEHHSQGNYFWLLSGSDQNVGFEDVIPSAPISATNLAQQLIQSGRSFKGYSEDLPKIGSTVKTAGLLYARKHVPWVSFSNIPNGTKVGDSSNLRFKDFPSDFHSLPTVSIVVPNLVDDMHDGSNPINIRAGDKWLRNHIDGYRQWAKDNNSLLIVTFDENDHGPSGLTRPNDPTPAKQNRIVTILAGAHIKPGDYPEGKGVTHVNLLRTLEAMYGLGKSGVQQEHAAQAGITDVFIITDVFSVGP